MMMMMMMMSWTKRRRREESFYPASGTSTGSLPSPRKRRVTTWAGWSHEASIDSELNGLFTVSPWQQASVPHQDLHSRSGSIERRRVRFNEGETQKCDGGVCVFKENNWTKTVEKETSALIYSVSDWRPRLVSFSSFRRTDNVRSDFTGAASLNNNNSSFTHK